MSSAAKPQPHLSVEAREPTTGPVHIELSVEYRQEADEPAPRLRTVAQIALPALLSKGPLPGDRTVIFKNVDPEASIKFSFPTVYDRNVFENPAKLVEDGEPKKFLLPPGGEESFVVRAELGLIGSHSEEDNRFYSYEIETEPELWYAPNTDHEVGHVGC
jgi:hypothetical protein